MNTVNPILIDSFGRKHTYLRISLTDHCNLRCFYCMPEEGVDFQDKKNYLTASEIIEISKIFVGFGVTKIRLTGGEPLIRKDFEYILLELAKLNIELALTTNGVFIDKYIDLFGKVGLKNINVSLDSLDEDKNLKITKRDFYQRIVKNLALLQSRGITPKLNMVVMRDVNDNELVDFVELTKNSTMDVRFLEFMPFNGNHWQTQKCFSKQEILDNIYAHYGLHNVLKTEDSENSTSRSFQIAGYSGRFGIISSITHPFCHDCNRIRLTADGKLKNCLFSQNEFDLRTPLRAGGDTSGLIQECITHKKQERAGLDFTDNNILKLEENRSMITIGG